MAAVDFFLKLDGIDGESDDAKHKGEIQIESFSWGLSNSGSAAHGGGGGAGKASFQDFHFTSSVSKASPKLFLACCTGEHIKQCVITCRKAGENQTEFYVIKLTDILISSFEQAGSSSSDAVPTDSFSLNYSKVEMEYRPQSRDGATSSPVKAGWDLAKNVKI